MEAYAAELKRSDRSLFASVERFGPISQHWQWARTDLMSDGDMWHVVGPHTELD